jgi:multiple sugar transport system permease protein
VERAALLSVSTGDRSVNVAVRPIAQPAQAGSSRAYFRYRELIGYAYIAPWAAGFLLFVAFPLVMSLYLSFTQYNIITAPVFVGLENYRVAFFEDQLFWSSIWRTAQYAVLAGTLGVIGSLLAALLLNQELKGTTIFRTLYYLPSLTPIVASALLWVWIFQPKIGVLNYLLDQVGITGPPWLQSSTWAIPSLVIIALWGGIGGSRMIVFLAGLQGVPQELYDSASVDGASSVQRFWYVTLPMISPVVFFNTVIVVIGSFRVFSVSYIATAGGPAYATYFYIYHLFQNAFNYLQMGYAAALAWIFFALMLGFTFLQFRASRRWVFYSGEVKDDGK